MKFEITEQGQVLLVTDIVNEGDIVGTIKTHYCMLNETKKERVNNQYKITELHFNTTTNKQDIVSEVFESISKDTLLKELKEKYLPQIKDADLLGDIIEKERLQQEYLQKKLEIESQYAS